MTLAAVVFVGLTASDAVLSPADFLMSAPEGQCEGEARPMRSDYQRACAGVEEACTQEICSGKDDQACTSKCKKVSSKCEKRAERPGYQRACWDAERACIRDMCNGPGDHACGSGCNQVRAACGDTAHERCKHGDATPAPATVSAAHPQLHAMTSPVAAKADEAPV
eukprot:CAMPEP_0119420826 /NCGR_PEP_ID=MMETSP1335-20130426/24400_1 /TAXON_ID=259385 /ORGANISM="Chrysoculter rhomboideus, Strain RCC1486" /LENGTH=165 /DNA_ID=CAMNT_0007446203 /DNA_START=58 /DNA_END=551 /DNA_ORIENTATION=+